MEIFEALKMSANNADSPNNEYGWGIINIYAAYEYLALPQISHQPLSDSENYNGPYTVIAEVSSNYDIIAGSPKLFYRVNTGSWNEIIMNISKESNNYTANIPGTGSPASYDYYITAENVNASVSSPENAPGSFYSFITAPDNEAPQINHNSIAEYYKNLWGQAQVIAELTDNLGIDIENSHVEWKINGTQQDNISFSNNSENIYSAYFPYSNLNYDDLIEYKIIAQDISEAQNIATFPTSGFQSFNITDRISFEQNQFSHNWIFSGDNDWFVSSSQHQNGIYSAQSGSVNDGENSSITLNFTCDDTGTISFYKKVSSEEDYDYLNFYINDIKQDEWAGNLDWTEETYNINAGSYTLKWEYKKDGSISNGSDCAWIDNITLPGIINTYTVTFNVTDGTNPIENANINFRSQNELTNASGQAVFSEIASGNDIQYTVSKSGYNDYSDALSVINQDVTENVVLSSSSGIIVSNSGNIKIYPVPADRIITIDIQNSDFDNYEIEFINISGKTVKKIISYQNNSIIDISNIANGIYFCKIKIKEKIKFVKFIVN